MKCPGKRRHTSERSAIAAAIRLSRGNRPLRVYRCPLCKGWHLTKQEKRGRRDELD